MNGFACETLCPVEEFRMATRDLPVATILDRTKLTTVEDIQDEVLVAQMHNGHTEALGALFDRYYRLIFDVTKRILRDPSEAEDVMQEVFLEIYRRAELYDPAKGSVKTWILQYAYHRSFNRRKYLALRGFYDASTTFSPAEVQPKCKPSQLERMNSLEWQELLQQALRELNQRQRQIIELIVFDGLNVCEASAQVGESYLNGRNHYYRGLKKLRQILVRSTTTSREVNRNTRTTTRIEHVEAFLGDSER
jgi:RNA polymerase sigma-70 factor, ECF subfamily